MEVDLMKAWYLYFADAAQIIPPRVWLWLLGIALAIPTSYYGFVWLQYKFVKQRVNCYADLYGNIGSASPRTPEAQLDQVMSELSAYNDCNKSVNPKIGTIEFVKKEYERSKGVGP